MFSGGEIATVQMEFQEFKENMGGGRKKSSFLFSLVYKLHGSRWTSWALDLFTWKVVGTTIPTPNNILAEHNLFD